MQKMLVFIYHHKITKQENEIEIVFKKKIARTHMIRRL